MRLRYDTSIAADGAPLILTKPDAQRVEIHIRRDPDGSATMVAFSGREHQQPDKAMQQGPYQLYDQAVAAKRAIGAQLKDAGFTVSESHPQWSLAVQRTLNQQRTQKQLSGGDYRFDPKDVFLDW